MFLRVTSVKRDNKTYFYTQIVQSYRRTEDGLPAHKVIANLGQLSELEISNLKNAFLASKENKKTFIGSKVLKSAVKLSKPNVHRRKSRHFQFLNNFGFSKLSIS